jgi:hypothetical protein
MEMLRGRIDGLKVSLRIARESERLFIKSQTLAEQIAKSQSDIDKLTEQREEVVSKRESLKAKKAELLQGALEPINQAITELLPRGEAVITINGGLFIGWKNGPKVTPYLGLSGGERVGFDGALCSAMLKGSGDKIIVFESAEVDMNNLKSLLSAITKVHPEVQVIVSTWAKPEKEEIPQGWNVVTL